MPVEIGGHAFESASAVEHARSSQKACVRAPMKEALPSIRSPLRKVKVCDHADMGFALPDLETERRAGGHPLVCATEICHLGHPK